MKNFHCIIFGHNLKISKHVTSHVKEYSCKNCKQEFTTNSIGNLITLANKHKEINSVLKHIHKRRMAKSNKINTSVF